MKEPGDGRNGHEADDDHGDDCFGYWTEGYVFKVKIASRLYALKVVRDCPPPGMTVRMAFG